MGLFERKKKLLSGPVLLGFAPIFDRAYGDPKTPGPYPKIIPSVVAGVLLPFECPYCAAVTPQVIDPKTRLGYRDRERGFSWCPSCRGRYDICLEGTPLVGAMPEGATHAPALVERAGKSLVIGLASKEDGLLSLGAV